MGVPFWIRRALLFRVADRLIPATLRGRFVTSQHGRAQACARTGTCAGKRKNRRVLGVERILERRWYWSSELSLIQTHYSSPVPELSQTKCLNESRSSDVEAARSLPPPCMIPRPSSKRTPTCHVSLVPHRMVRSGHIHVEVASQVEVNARTSWDHPNSQTGRGAGRITHRRMLSRTLSPPAL